MPASLQQVVEARPVVKVQQSMTATLPSHTLTEIPALQLANTIISEILPFWRQKAHAGLEE